MLIERIAEHVVVWAPAKVNLHLEILGKRADGYHELETLMMAVNLCDTLELHDDPSGRLSMRCNAPELSTGPDNLVMRAAALLRTTTGCRHGAAIELGKRIPMAGGLAGGSTDAAATLAGLNELWALRLTRTQLTELSAQLGSDVAFFFHTPAAWCTGRGEIVAPAPVGKRIWLVLLCPPFGLATADVYRKVSVPAQPRSGDTIRAALTAGDVEQVGRSLHNRLQPAATLVNPAIGDYQRLLEQSAAAGAQMSGSGSTLFAVCRHRLEARRIVQQLQSGADTRRPARVYLVRTCS